MRATVFTTAMISTGLLIGGIMLGCKPKEETLTNDEAKEALNEAVSAEQALSMTYETVEVTTDFTIGDGVQAAAENVRDFIQSQIPCSTATLEDTTLTIDYGKLEDGCEYRNKTYAGVHVVTFMKNEPGEVVVSHSWQDMTDGNVTVNGAATVTWSADNRTRRVEHDLEWVGPNGGTVVASGDRTQSLVDPDMGLGGGIQIDGERSWTTSRGTWQLDIDGVQVHAQDPVPQRGVYTLTTPDAKTLGLSFMRIDDNTIEVTMTGLRRDRVFNVRRGGQISESARTRES